MPFGGAVSDDVPENVNEVLDSVLSPVPFGGAVSDDIAGFLTLFNFSAVTSAFRRSGQRRHTGSWKRFDRPAYVTSAFRRSGQRRHGKQHAGILTAWVTSAFRRSGQRRPIH